MMIWPGVSSAHAFVSVQRSEHANVPLDGSHLHVDEIEHCTPRLVGPDSSFGMSLGVGMGPMRFVAALRFKMLESQPGKSNAGPASIHFV